MKFYEKKIWLFGEKTYDTVPTSMALRFTKKKNISNYMYPKL